ncbi:MAG: HD-GYP domain-containing protein [Lachnospiraceae bacterium]|nr:HD-GYP domain-containing protein [Lachnospiraceae bacterium]
MNSVEHLKKIIRNCTYAVLAVTAVIFVLFIIHIINVGKYNEEWRVITPHSSATQVIVDIHPRGGVTDSWEKVDTGLDTALNAKIYEMVVTNNAHTYVDDWYLRVNISESCYLNNGWCGTFEVHQFDESKNEVSQTLDLRNFSYSDITIGYHQAGQDLLLPLVPGDYFIYHPDTSDVSGEVPIKGTQELSGCANCGVIMYSISGDVNLSDYELSYRLHKTIWEGSEGMFFTISFFVIALSLLILGTIFLVSVRFEGRFRNQGNKLRDTFRICCSIADSRDYYSKEHSQRVAEYSRIIAEKLGLEKNDCDDVYNAALLHNIGNAFVSEHILRKNSKLTREEYAEVKKHTVRGSELLKDVTSIPYVREAALYHHERFDGTGYPHGKKEDEIPLIARIIAVADAYDAMNNDRPFRSKLMHEQIREEFIKNRGTQFDPSIVTAFLDIMGERNL